MIVSEKNGVYECERVERWEVLSRHIALVVDEEAEGASRWRDEGYIPRYFRTL